MSVWGIFVGLITWIAPCLFFAGIIAQTVSRTRAAPQNSKGQHSEPFVFTFLGAWFLIVNGPLLQQMSFAMEYRLGASASALLSSENLTLFRTAFGLAAVSVVATLAKAFWTHVQLENNYWGEVRNYRKKVWEKGARFGWLEYALRCLIAVVIVYMQKLLGDISNIEGIQIVSSGEVLDQVREAEFVNSFSQWLAGFSRTAFYLYLLIIVWLSIVWSAHSKAYSAVIGTATSTVPALIVVWAMYFMSTSSVLPLPLGRIEIGSPDPVIIFSTMLLFFFLSLIIVANLAWTIWKGPIKEIRNQLDLFLKEKKV